MRLGSRTFAAKHDAVLRAGRAGTVLEWHPIGETGTGTMFAIAIGVAAVPILIFRRAIELVVAIDEPAIPVDAVLVSAVSVSAVSVSAVSVERAVVEGAIAVHMCAAAIHVVGAIAERR